MLTLNDFFLPAERDLAQGVASGLQSGDETFVVRTGPDVELKKLKWSMLSETVAKHVGALLDIRITDIMVSAWNKSRTLRQHLGKTAASPDESALLPLAGHTITSEHRPFIEILRNGKQVAKLVFPVSIVLVLEGVVLRVQNGEIKEIQTGQVKCKGSLRCGRAVLVEKDLQPIHLPGTIALGQEAG